MYAYKGEMNRTISENSMFIDGASHERNIRFLGSYSERDSWLQTGVLVGFAEIPIHRYKIYFEHIPKPLHRWMKLFSWWQTATSIVEFRSKMITRLYLYILYIYSNKKSHKNVTAYREGQVVISVI